MKDEKVFAMKFSDVYPMLVAKAERKGRTREEVDTVTRWLTGYRQDALEVQLERGVDYRTFFAEAPRMNPNRALIKGSICGVRVEDIEDPLMQEIRQLDKLVDELAKGRAMNKILRKCETIEDYIATVPEEIRPILRLLQERLRQALPGTTEKIAWGMPTYWKGHNIFHFAAAKKHLGIYPGTEAVKHFADRLEEEGYAYSKGAIQFPYKREIPYDFIIEIARWCYEKEKS